MTVIKKWDVDCLRAVIHDLKIEALNVGRYNPPFTDEAYERRREQHGQLIDVLRNPGMGYETIPFRCGLHNTRVHQVTALERILKEFINDDHHHEN